MKTISSHPSPATLHSNLPIQHPFRSPTSVHPLALGTGSTADSCTVVVVNVAILSNLNLGENYLPTSLFVRKVTRSVKPDVTLPSRSFALTKNLVLANLPHPPPPTRLRRIPVTLPWTFRGFALWMWFPTTKLIHVTGWGRTKKGFIRGPPNPVHIDLALPITHPFPSTQLLPSPFSPSPCLAGPLPSTPNQPVAIPSRLQHNQLNLTTPLPTSPSDISPTVPVKALHQTTPSLLLYHTCLGWSTWLENRQHA